VRAARESGLFLRGVGIVGASVLGFYECWQRINREGREGEIPGVPCHRSARRREGAHGRGARRVRRCAGQRRFSVP
jgi:hypothetical protein